MPEPCATKSCTGVRQQNRYCYKCFYAANRTKRIALVANWRKNNPEKHAIQQARNIAKVRATKGLSPKKPMTVQEKGYRTIRGIFMHARSKSKQHKRNWTISLEEYELLRNSPCVYCQYPLPPKGIGLDRLNNQLGYEPSNVVPCCTVCNTARNNNFTHTEMRMIGEVIRRIRLAREATQAQEVPLRSLPH